MDKLNGNIAAKSAVGFVVSICTFLFGKADYWLMALIAFLVIDYITGFAAAFIAKELSSRMGTKGIVKKVLFLAVVAVAHIIDSAMGLSGTVRAIVIGFLVANEGLSILENCARCGLPIPKKLIDTLKQVRDKARNDISDKGEQEND